MYVCAYKCVHTPYLQVMFGSPVIVLTEEVQCRKKTRSLLPGEQCPAGLKCSAES